MMITVKYKNLGLLSAMIVSAFGITAAHAADQNRYVVYGNGYGQGLPVAGYTPSTVNTTGASGSIPPVSQRVAQYKRESVDSTFNQTSTNTAIGRTLNGQVIYQSPTGPVPIDAKTRYYTPDNAYLEQRRAIIRAE